MRLQIDDVPVAQRCKGLSNVKKSNGCNALNARLPTTLSEEMHDVGYVLKRNGYSIRPVTSHIRRIATSALLQRMYSWRGYDTTDAEMFTHSDGSITFEVFHQQQIFGTLTLGVDGEEGLLADKLHKSEINSFRVKKRKVCELSKFAIDSRYGSKEVLASLFHLSYIYGRDIYNTDDVFIEVNPRHMSFYKRMLGFRPISKIRTCKRVDAPAVLMHLDVEYMNAKIASLANSRDYKDRSLYPYFLSRHEEETLAATLRRHIN